MERATRDMNGVGSEPEADCTLVVFPALDADLTDAVGEPGGRTRRVCIATPDILGPVKNGGIGTAYHHLARLLAGWGHQVVIAYVNGNAASARLMDRARAFYAGFDIAFEPLIPRPAAKTTLAQVAAPTWALHDWLRGREQPFDVVHVSDWRGLGYGSLLAKSLGLAFGATHFVVHGHGPTLWNVEGNRQLVSTERELGWVFMERRSVELADTLTCGSAHLLGWMHDAGYAMPARSFVWPNPFPAPETTPEAVAARAARDGAALKEVVFFGRLEPRKGLVLFIDAVDRLVRRGRAPSGRITFLGSSAERIDGPGFIRSSARGWPVEVRTITDLGAEEAVAYLSQPGRLAVLPSLQENSSLAVTECLHTGIPFIATATGGTPELIAPEDHDRALVEPDHIALGERIAGLASVPLRAVRPHWDFERSLEVWSSWHAQSAPVEAATRFAQRTHFADAETPPVTVCIIHHERPALLRMAVDSVLAQDYPALEAVLVDDGSEGTEALEAFDAIETTFAERGWRVLRQDNRFKGAARNAAAAAARGEWLLFLDDDNVLFPDAVSRLVHAARFSGADCVTAASIRFFGDGDPRIDTASHGTPIRFLGAARAWCRFRNVIGDTCALVRREAFLAIGGFNEEYRVGLEDLSFFNHLIHAGYRIEPTPDPTYFYRFGNTSTKKLNRSPEAAQLRVLTPYLQGQTDEERAYAAYSATRIRSTTKAPARPAAPQLRRKVHAMALARRRSGLRFENLELGVLLDPEWVERTRHRSEPKPIIELRCNGRTQAQAFAQDVLRDTAWTAAGLRIPAIYEALYSVHDARTGEVLASLITPAFRHARLIVGAVENRQHPDVRGWVLDPSNPEQSRKVALHVDGLLREVIEANEQRGDLARWKEISGDHGFLWRVPGDLAAKDGTRIDVFDANTGRSLRGSPLHIEAGRVIASERHGT